MATASWLQFFSKQWLIELLTWDFLLDFPRHKEPHPGYAQRAEDYQCRYQPIEWHHTVPARWPGPALCAPHSPTH